MFSDIKAFIIIMYNVTHCSCRWVFCYQIQIEDVTIFPVMVAVWWSMIFIFIVHKRSWWQSNDWEVFPGEVVTSHQQYPHCVSSVHQPVWLIRDPDISWLSDIRCQLYKTSFRLQSNQTAFNLCSQCKCEGCEVDVISPLDHSQISALYLQIQI